jgi:uncharacterized protein (TIGR02271 family)
MSRTVTAMFDSRSEAEAAKTRLCSSNIDAERVRIIDQSSTSSSYTSSGSTTSGGEGHGFWASLKEMFVEDSDRHVYGEGISRGSFLLTAEVDEDEADQAVRLLEESDSIDIDERQNSWRSEGWNGYSSAAGTSAFAGSTMDTDRTSATGTGFASAATTGTQNFGTTDRSTTVDEERIPIVEEELRVGKREVSRGGARVRSYVREIPVHEQVSLREEHVSVGRRPVTDTLRAGDLGTADAFQERNIEMTETTEEAVIDKRAKVTEEVVVRKTAEEHVENVDDTVRRTEVEIDEGLRGSEDRSAFGSFGSGTAGTSGTTGTTDRTDTDLEGSNLQDRSRGF